MVYVPFFEGNGLNIGMGISYPYGTAAGVEATEYDSALNTALETLSNDFGYESYFSNSNTLVVFNSVCGTNDAELNFELIININFSFEKP